MIKQKTGSTKYGMLAAAMVVMTTAAVPVQASDYGCSLVLCLAASKPWDVKECVPTLKKWVKSQAKFPKDPFPKCKRVSEDGVELPGDKERGEVVDAPCPGQEALIKKCELEHEDIVKEFPGDDGDSACSKIKQCSYVDLYIDGNFHGRTEIKEP